MSTHLEIHILQTLPPSNVNRDDTGNPKTAVYGGVRRARVSSQAWKRATRAAYKDLLDMSDLGVRTKRAVELLVERMRRIDTNLGEESARIRAGEVMGHLGIKLDKAKPASRKSSDGDAAEAPGFDTTAYLVFWSNQQLDRLARLGLADEKVSRNMVRAAADAQHGIDVALFGRMVADSADFNVDAAVQVAHALSTHAVEIEQDYFTAVDDSNPETETGAGMIGTVDFDSSTLYRYATVNVDLLLENLAGDEDATVRAVEAFVRGFITSMPTGKQNTFANRTPADAVLVTIRSDQPLNLVGAFESPVEASRAHIRASAEALATHFEEVRSFLGAPDTLLLARSTSEAASLDRLGAPVPLSDLVASAGSAVRERLGAA